MPPGLLQLLQMSIDHVLSVCEIGDGRHNPDIFFIIKNRGCIQALEVGVHEMKRKR